MDLREFDVLAMGRTGRCTGMTKATATLTLSRKRVHTHSFSIQLCSIFRSIVLSISFSLV